eukprot:scaffold17668_cov39-Isochrysis_galbana.AAC.1
MRSGLGGLPRVSSRFGLSAAAEYRRGWERIGRGWRGGLCAGQSPSLQRNTAGRARVGQGAGDVAARAVQSACL